MLRHCHFTGGRCPPPTSLLLGQDCCCFSFARKALACFSGPILSFARHQGGLQRVVVMQSAPGSVVGEFRSIKTLGEPERPGRPAPAASAASVRRTNMPISEQYMPFDPPAASGKCFASGRVAGVACGQGRRVAAFCCEPSCKTQHAVPIRNWHDQVSGVVDLFSLQASWPAQSPALCHC